MPWDIKTFNNQVVNGDEEVYELLNISPNEEMTSFSWKVMLIVHCFTKGNFFNEIVRDNTGKVRAIVPIIDHDIQMVRTTEGTLLYQLSNTKSDSIVYLRKEEVLHFKNLHTDDGINGLSLINYAARTLGIAHGADKMAGNMFANGGMPAGTLKTEAVLSDEVIERLKDNWKTKFGGNKAGGIAVLEQGMSFDPINFAPDVLQFLESRQFSVVEIARYLGVPPSKLYVLEAQSYNNIEHSNLEVSNDTIDVWAKNIEGEVNMKLLRSKKLKSDLDLYAINRGDMDTRSSYFTKMVGIGALSPNEVRQKEGKAPYKGGDEKYISTNNLSPISRHDEIIDAQIKDKENKKDTDKNNKEIEKTLNERLKK